MVGRLHRGVSWGGPPPSWRDVELWIALLLIALGMVALACLVLGAAIGSGWRLFMLTSGRARLARPVRVRPVPGVWPGSETTNPLPVVELPPGERQ